MINPEYDHINSNHHDNSLNNLRWLSAKDNIMRREGYNMLPDKTIIKIADEIMKNELSPTEIAIKFNFTKY